MPRPVIPIRPPYTPELMPAVQLLIERFLIINVERPQVFEYGSGFSTIWLAQYSQLVSVEHDEEWFYEVVAALKRAKLKAMVNLVGEEKIAETINEYDQMFDLVFVDCHSEYRNAAVEASMKRVKRGGCLVLEDSHWRHLARSKRLLESWNHVVVSGKHKRKNGKIAEAQTSIYWKE